MRHPYYSAQQKAAWLAHQLTIGETFTTRQVADKFGMTWHGADEMINRVTTVVPATKNNGTWEPFQYYVKK